MIHYLRSLALLFVLLLAAVLVACGGGGSAKPTATVEEPTEEPEATATETAGGPTRAPSGAQPFDSYHYTVELEFTINDPAQTAPTTVAGNVEGDFVAPDSHAFASQFEFAGLSVTEEAVIIGDDAWFRESGGEWRTTTRQDADVQNAVGLTSADPEFLQDEEFAEGIAALESEPETINGVETRRYHIPKEAVETLSALLGEDFLADTAGLTDFEMTVWLGDETDGLVRAEFTATATPDVFGDEAPFDLSAGATVSITMTINLTSINDESIAIEPPV